MKLPSPKRMQNISGHEMATVSNEGTSSSSDDDKKKAGCSNERENSEEMNDSDEEADPWGVLVHEEAAELGTKHNELVQSHENDGFNEIDAKK